MSTVPAAPVHRRPVALARGFLTGGVIGATLSAFVVGIILERVPLILAALGLPLAYGVLVFVAGMPRRAREAAVVPRVALAKVESLRAGGTETGDVPVDLVLTVAPDDAPSYRAEVTHQVNLVDLPGFRRGDVVVVEYPPDRPWQVRIVPRPAPAWERRRAGATVESAPESALVRSPPEGCAAGAVTLTGLLLAAAAVLVLFRADLFGPESSEPPIEPPATSVTSSAGSATVTVGPGQTLLDAGELRRVVDSLAGNADVSQVLTAVVEERRLSVVFAPTAAAVPRFDLRAVPFEQIPDLVGKAVHTSDAGSPRSWQVVVDPFSVRVTVTGPEGSSSSTPCGGSPAAEGCAWPPGR
ncbi:hypothetical protein AB0M83_37050 [Amycolatopsis sp. NPDC051106]|uniref:hypothetical protein n=1 Tax=unclassified Amycolatopsis TaxID=2618356 RepID=UPI00341E79F7